MVKNKKPGFLQAVPSNKQKLKQTETERKAKAEQLKRVFAREKVRHGWTQESLAKKMNISQGTLGGYLSGRYTISTDFILSMAQALNVSPEEFDPGIFRVLKRTPVEDRIKVKIPLLGAISGTLTADKRGYTVAAIKQEQVSGMLFGITIDTEAYEPGLRQGSVAIIDPLAPIKEHDYVAVRRIGQEQYEIYKIKTLLASGDYTVQLLTSDDLTEDGRIRYEFDQEIVLHKSELMYCEKIVNFEMP